MRKSIPYLIVLVVVFGSYLYFSCVQIQKQTVLEDGESHGASLIEVVLHKPRYNIPFWDFVAGRIRNPFKKIELFFSPAHFLDRHLLRPSIWEKKVENVFH